jgi:hypothetical protein
MGIQRVVLPALLVGVLAARGEASAPALQSWPVDALVKVFPADRARASPAPGH